LTLAIFLPKKLVKAFLWRRRLERRPHTINGIIVIEVQLSVVVRFFVNLWLISGREVRGRRVRSAPSEKPIKILEHSSSSINLAPSVENGDIKDIIRGRVQKRKVAIPDSTMTSLRKTFGKRMTIPTRILYVIAMGLTHFLKVTMPLSVLIFIIFY